MESYSKFNKMEGFLNPSLPNWVLSLSYIMEQVPARVIMQY